MADVSSIPLAAGDLGPTPSALDILKKWQDLSSAQSSQAQTESSTVNQQLEAQKRQLDLGIAHSNRIIDVLSGIQKLPPEQRQAAAQQALDAETAQGMTTPAGRADAQRAISAGGATLDNWLLQHQQQLLTGMEKMRYLYGQPVTVDHGPYSETGSLTVAGPGTGLVVPTGQIIQKGLSPSELATQQEREATQADVDAAKAAGLVPPQIGQKINGAMYDRLIQQQHGGLVAPAPLSGGTVAPLGGGSAPAPTSAVPQRTVPPLGANGQPVGPTNPAGTLPPTPGTPRTSNVLPGGGVVTGAPPNTGAERALDTAAYDREWGASQRFQQENQQYGSALTALKNVRTGPGTETINHWQSFLQAISPEAAKRLGVNASEVEYFDEAKKYLTALAQSTPGAAGTDMRLALSQVSNPSTAISNAAAQKMLGTAMAFRQMQQAIFSDYQHDHPQYGDSQGIARHIQEKLSNLDYHAWLPDDAQFEQYARSLANNPAARKRLHDSIELRNSYPVVQ